jgi:outer membrane protein assembly factor BamB
VAEATADTGFIAAGVFEIMQLQGNNLVLSGNKRRALSSYVATSTAAGATKAYATTGDAGGLFGINPATLATTDSIPLHDARWVTVAEGKLVVVQGTPGQIVVYNESTMNPVGTFPFPGADIAQSKSQAVVVGGKAFIAAGDSGVQVLSDSTGKIVGSVPRPNPDSLGLSPSVVVTNAVAVDQDLMFISNGEAGVYLAQGSQLFSASGSEAVQTITMRGRLRFGNLQSVNHVAYQSKYLIIAAGLGGLKIVQVI